ncbi:MAG TPA: rRNA maturation RNase YbeY [Candidatus Sphingobacterium stercorigallinarum]|nr:rRNA maturation RNase YbeY [Candidatus Sphingobacterium stercorigallinarum]
MALRDIHFFSEDIDFTLQEKQKIRQWIGHTIVHQGYARVGELNFIFCSDAYLLNINQTYLKHDTYTDIVTFDSSESQDVIAGDVFISVERIRENAQEFGVSERDELHRVMIHGVLHLCGQGDKTEAEQKQMTEKENFYLSERSF